MSKKSGAIISISESISKEYGRVWRYIQIRGTGRAVDRAKKLLHIRLERLEPRALEKGVVDLEEVGDGDGDGDGGGEEVESHPPNNASQDENL
jgi:hypothetical protein